MSSISGSYIELKITVIVEDMSEAIDAVTLYEWAIVDGFYGDVY
jgi:hypothetical protein